MNLLVTTKRTVLFLLLSLLANLAFAQGPQLIQATDDIYLFGAGAFSMFVVTSDGVVVVDPIEPHHAQLLDAAIDTVTDQPVRFVLYSHNHWDHISGGQIFKDQGAIFISHADTAEHLKPNPAVVTPDLTWTGSESTITVGDKTIELHHFGPSHGEGMTVFTIPEDRVMYTVDLVVAKRVGFMHMPDFTIDGWINTLDQIIDLDYDVALFAHATSTTPPVGTKEDVVAQRQFVVDLTTAVQEAMMSGGFMAAMAVTLPQYEDWAFYDDWISLNVMSAVLHAIMGY
jgi:glyoxylase-like metal-dependent hydrolase (beta-lactamase superfamily II)